MFSIRILDLVVALIIHSNAIVFLYPLQSQKLKRNIQRYIFITKSASQLIICILYILSRMKQETCLRNVVSKLSQEFPEHTSKHLILISLISFFNTCSVILNFVSLAISIVEFV